MQNETRMTGDLSPVAPHSRDGLVPKASRRRSWLAVAIVMALGGCSDPSDGQDMEREIVESLRVGEAAADSTPPFGFDLYPDAKVTMALLQGMSLAIRSDASLEAIADFYEGQLTDHGWQIESREREDGKITLTGVMPSKPSETMKIAIGHMKGHSGEFSLTFLKLIHDA
ncbi:MAG: hypothetical protein DI637_12505 [Citromicrobium sp.]|nr:MAG: hypothetical protein DI637_12505 [Citromicrobium sp.]